MDSVRESDAPVVVQDLKMGNVEAALMHDCFQLTPPGSSQRVEGRLIRSKTQLESVQAVLCFNATLTLGLFPYA